MEKKVIMQSLFVIMQANEISLEDMEKFIQKKKEDKFKAVKPQEPSFIFEVDEVYKITGRGVVVSGKVVKGELKEDSPLMLIPLKSIAKYREGKDNGARYKRCHCKGIEKFRKIETSCKEGESCALLLKGIAKEEIQRGDWLVDEGLVLEKERSNFSEGEKLKRAKS